MVDSMEATDSIPLTQQYASALESAIGYYHQQSATTDAAWTILQPDLDSRSSQIQLSQMESSFKVVAQCNDNWLPHDWQSVFMTESVRKLWDSELESYKVLDRPDDNIQITQIKMKDSWDIGPRDLVLVEKATHKKHSMLYVIVSLSTPFKMVYDIQQPDPISDARVTLYYQLGCSSLPTHRYSYLVSLVTGPLEVLQLHGVVPFVSHSVRFHIEATEYDKDTRTWELQYTQPQEEPSLASSVGSIHIHQDRHLGSWEHHHSTGSLPLASSLRRNSFMASSLFLPQHGLQRRNLSMSYPDKEPLSWSDSAVSKLEIEVDGHTWAEGSIVEVSVDTGHREWTEQYTKSCIQCFRRPQANRYLICVLHPPDIARFLRQTNIDDLDDIHDESYEEAFRVKVILTSKPCDDKGFRFILNGKEWPLHLWIARKLITENGSNDENSSVSSSNDDDDHNNDEGDHSGVDNDIFVDGMEEIGERTVEAEVQVVVNNEKEDKTENKAAEEEDEEEEEKQVEKDLYESHEDIDQIPDLSSSQLLDTITVPETDPATILKAFNYFDALFRDDNVDWKILQVAEAVNGYVTIKRMEVPGHPLGVFMSESVWNDCSVWDVKATIECIGSRKMWDPLLEESTLLYSVSPTCSIWHNKHKGTWPSSPRDYVVFASQYTSAKRIDLCSTSCTTESFNHQPLPKEAPGYVRGHLDVSGWRLERVNASTTAVKHIVQSNPQGWIPSYVLNKLSSQTPIIVHTARKFMLRHGVPPNMESLERGRVIATDYDHERKNWRCEYTRPSVQTNSESSSTKSVIRLDRRHGCKYNVVVDPPPSRIRAVERDCDMYGIWLDIEHDEEFIIPQRGRILVLIKPHNNFLAVNGAEVAIQRDTNRMQQSDTTSNDEEETSEMVSDELGLTIQGLPVSPADQAQAAFAFMRRVDDQQFGWTLISDKNGLRISKRPGSKPSADNTTGDHDLRVPEPFVIYKASKVIEGFSLEEIAAVVTDIGNLRQSYDETLEKIESVRCIKRGCHVVHQIIKAIFPFKSRELYLCACTAYEKIPSTENASGDRVFYVETSLPFPSQQAKYPRGHLFVSGWILESIDPYTTTTNYPIPSMRATYIVALDLGDSVPSYVSNLVASGYHKKISWIESLMKKQGPPPFLRQPLPAMRWENHKLTQLEDESVEWKRVESSYDETTHRFSLALSFRCARLKKLERRGSLSKDVDTVLSHIITDLQSYPRGYQLSCRLTREHKDVSRILSVQISELAPQPSHLISRKPKKHAIYVTAKLRKGVDYDLVLTLSPAVKGDEGEVRKQLTVNEILGEEEDDRWRGIVIVNGQEVNVNSETKMDINKEDATDGEEASDDVIDESAPVFTTSIPLEGASTSGNANDDTTSGQETRKENLQDETAFLPVIAAETSDEPRCSRTKVAVIMLLLCIGFAIILALLMLQPLETLDVSDNVKPLWRFSALGGWEIQVIAIHRAHV
ncbi:hypothetical protein EC973_001404 [Apophysomyces ossiformis]|uniref:START domain-containing protein n=1 Tax=Apophysomyces ossiformis TaxID=679940 RepID=A0A8H7BTT8_9FUNG|nr:hypothetical protein EC973_001404 [Apophysomyces ossiformis]